MVHRESSSRLDQQGASELMLLSKLGPSSIALRLRQEPDFRAGFGCGGFLGEFTGTQAVHSRDSNAAQLQPTRQLAVTVDG